MTFRDCLACSSTEIVHALGFADLLVGVDDHSDWPVDVVALQVSRYCQRRLTGSGSPDCAPPVGMCTSTNTVAKQDGSPTCLPRL